jgi:hypothetical protein
MPRGKRGKVLVRRLGWWNMILIFFKEMLTDDGHGEIYI